MENGIKAAAFDLKCEARNLRVDDLGNGAMGVEGCGRRARYVYLDGTGWVQN